MCVERTSPCGIFWMLLLKITDWRAGGAILPNHRADAAASMALREPVIRSQLGGGSELVAVKIAAVVYDGPIGIGLISPEEISSLHRT